MTCPDIAGLVGYGIAAVGQAAPARAGNNPRVLPQ
jgi:hypothetical protein